MDSAVRPAPATAGASAELPLVVDLDGTLTPTDTLYESVLVLLKRQPWLLLALLFWVCLGRSRLKQQVAARARFSTRNLPWRADLLDWLRQERARGRPLVLATAAHESIAHEASRQLGLFDSVLASTDSHNLKGSAKLAAIRQQVGEQFVYAGDSRADLPIWRAANAAVLVGASSGVSQAVHAGSTPVEREFARPATGWRLWAKALRVHQWVKNSLIFVPLLAAFAFGDMAKLLAAVLAFVAFSLAASATYVFNDLWDLDSDRQHPRKKERPFASARLPIRSGVAMAAALLLVAAAVALFVGPLFAAVLAGYVVITTAYSLSLKHYVLIDVMTLALLYTYRVLAGSVATGILSTPWLLAFSVFTFLSLALVKRCAELVLLQQGGRDAAQGRDYRTSDLVVLWPLGIGASMSAVVVFGLYIGTPTAALAYGNTAALWPVGMALIYWFARMWIKTARGEMHDDPIVFAFKDRASRLVLACVLALVLVAHFVR